MLLLRALLALSAALLAAADGGGGGGGCGVPDGGGGAAEQCSAPPPLAPETAAPTPPPPPPPPPAVPTPPPTCESIREGCDACRAAGCGWCLSTRRCVPDVAWQCQGETDHVGSVGTVKQCPSREELAEKRARRRAHKDGTVAAAAAARAAAEEQEAAVRSARAAAHDSPAAGGGGAPTAAPAAWSPSDEEHLATLRRRAELSRSATTAGLGGSGTRYGAAHPYETLGVTRAATVREIRKQYLLLSTRLHPDKNLAEVAEDAAAAFADLSAAYELLSDQAQREVFDAMHAPGAGGGGGGGSEQAFFHDEQSFRASGRDFASDLYGSSPLITELSSANFAQFVAGERVWVLNFYTPWCSHCQAFVPQYRALAEQLAEHDVDVGAVNCLKEAELCQSYDIRHYPSIRMVSARLGMHQDAHAVANSGVDAIAAWALEVRREWVWLFGAAELAELNGETFPAAVQGETDEARDFWLVLFLDGEDCGPCRVARSNVVRLSAGVRGLARVGVLDCDAEEPGWHEGGICRRLGLPAPPHQPVVRAFRRGRKGLDYLGEELFDPNDVEPHVALALTERLLRLALAQETVGESAVSLGEGGDFQKGEADEPSPSPPPPPPPPRWNGAQRRATNQLGGAPPSGPPAAFGGFIR
jgi:thiol-disulfide isomerase/thioredoxin